MIDVICKIAIGISSFFPPNPHSLNYDVYFIIHSILHFTFFLFHIFFLGISWLNLDQCRSASQHAQIQIPNCQLWFLKQKRKLLKPNQPINIS